MVVTRTTRNRFVGDKPAHGFESHLLCQNKKHPLGVFCFAGWDENPQVRPSDDGLSMKNKGSVALAYEYPIFSAKKAAPYYLGAIFLVRKLVGFE